MNHVTPYLPPAEGLLPTWLVIIAIVSLGNGVQAYVSLAGTREVYAGPSPSSTAIQKDAASPVNELSARTFGTWTVLAAIVRLYAAYNITNRIAYELAMWTLGIAWAHFVSEWLIFRTARLGKGLAGPLAVSTGTLTWMLLQWGNYVKN